MNIGIIGAGISGLVIGNKLSQQGHEITIYEERKHIGGNCYTEIDKDTGITVHKYGPHIFHTDDEEVWEFINKYLDMKPFVNRVKSTFNNQVYSLPINLHTINQFFKTNLNPKQAFDFISEKGDKSIVEAINFEQQALKFIGQDLYEAFFKGYTLKQWGMDPKHLPASILKRLPVRFNYNDNYFNHKYQGIPKDGYTHFFTKLIEEEHLKVTLGKGYTPSLKKEHDHIFFSGPLDSYFDYKFGRLGYRTLEFKKEYHNGDYQGCAVMNYANEEVPFTRITEHKHFAPWEEYEKTIIFKEYSKYCEPNDEPYYPIRQAEEKSLLDKYERVALEERNVSFIGRLGTYRYLDMDQTLKEALNTVKLTLKSIELNSSIPVFPYKSF